MDETALAIALSNLKQEKALFLYLEPQVVDFTKEVKGVLVIESKTEELRINLAEWDISHLMSLLNSSLFLENITLICWNMKSFFTYHFFYTKSSFVPENQIFDLKIAEGFMGIRENAPKTFAEAFARTKLVFNDESWPNFKKVFSKIYKPLIFYVLPSIETEGIINSQDRKILYSYYEIEGQTGGRLLCYKAYADSFNPHSILPMEREFFKLKRSDMVFLYLDFSHFEVSVLQWLTKDERLREILSQDGDFYSNLFFKLTGSECDNETKRNFCKGLFLPVIYGQQAASLSKKLNISFTTAEKLIKKIYNLFVTSFNWLNEQQTKEYVTDAHGRKRPFEGNYKTGNFLVQSSGALVSLEKLIKLFYKLQDCGKIIAHIHDGYLLAVPRSGVNMAWSVCKSVLESESELCEGLKLKATYKVGENLCELEEV